LEVARPWRNLDARLDKKLFGSLIEGLVINATLGFYLVAIIAECVSLFIRSTSVALCSSVFEHLRLLVLDIVAGDSLSHPFYFFTLPLFIHTFIVAAKENDLPSPHRCAVLLAGR
jgi:hypothetical protein